MGHPVLFRSSGARSIKSGPTSRTSISAACSDAQHDTGTEAQIVLVVIDGVVERGYQVGGVYQSKRDAASGAQIEASSEVGGKGSAGIGGRRTLALDQCSAGVRDAHQHLPEGLQVSWQLLVRIVCSVFLPGAVQPGWGLSVAEREARPGQGN